MGAKNDRKQVALEKDYREIMKDFQNPAVPITPIPQWTKPTDFIVKFSLYKESPSSITSTETTVFPDGY